MSYLDTGIIKPQTAAEMAEGFQAASKEIKEAYLLLRQAQTRLEQAFGSFTHYGDMNTVDRNIYWYQDEGLAYAQKIIDKLKSSAWHCIVNRLEIRKVMSEKRKSELDERLKHDKMPDVTVDEIFALINTFAQTVDDMGKEVIKDAYELLRPNTYYNKPYKTNRKSLSQGVGKKVILQWYVEHGWDSKGRMGVRYQRRDNLITIDRAFHLLDAGGIPNGYVSNLVDAINTSSNGKGESRYFKFEGYLNSNLHLEFKRMDLVERLNAICGGMTLKPKA
jgi:hypothetical protein